jgi:hypothetical protein
MFLALDEDLRPGNELSKFLVGQHYPHSGPRITGSWAVAGVEH